MSNHPDFIESGGMLHERTGFIMGNMGFSLYWCTRGATHGAQHIYSFEDLASKLSGYKSDGKVYDI